MTNNPGARFVATGIGVSDLERSADFYTRVLGMTVQQIFKLDHMDEIMVGYEGKGASLVLMHWTDGSLRNYRDNPIKLVFYVPDAAAAVEAMRGEGLEIEREPAASPGMGGALIAFGKDPDGYLVELIQRPAREAK